MPHVYITAIFLALAATAFSQLPPISGSATSPFLFDSAGRVRLFHGLNSVQKGAPWYPNDLLTNDTLLDEMASWGMTFMRLGWMWSGFEPSRGIFNMTYFNVTKTIVARLAARGIYTMLDMHQDALSSYFCLYDGIPTYIIEACMNKSTHTFPWPFSGSCSSRAWGQNEVTEAEGVCYQSLYDSGPSRDALGAFWAASATLWATDTNIVGYEFINEPFAGDIYKHPELLLPGEAGRRNLQPLYEFLAPFIFNSDNSSHLVFYEPVTWGMLFDQKVTGSGFTSVPGGPAFADRACLSYHYYCQSFSPNHPAKVLCDEGTGPLVFHAIASDIATIGGSSFLTEFGSCDENGWLPECSKVMDLADAHLQSWAEWSGTPQSPDFIAALSRTYAHATAGTPLTMVFNTTTAQFDFCFRVNTAIAAPTEIIAIFAQQYPQGVTITTTNGLVAMPDIPNNRIHVSTSAATINGQAGCVSVVAN